MMRKEVRYDLLPPHMADGARLYIERGIEPGGFLFNVLSNDLVHSYARADSVNTIAMHAWADWLWNECPMDAWGNRATVEAWIKRGGLLGAEPSKIA